MIGRPLLWLPLAAFGAIVALVALALIRPADRIVHSALIGQPLPRFALPGIGGQGVTSEATGRPRLLNVFASWCVPCAAEAPQLARLKAMGVAVDGLAVRDTPAAVSAFLARYGNPYRAIGDDRAGTVQLALGSSGVPESFVIDARGRVVRQHIGDIRAEDVPGIAVAVEGAP